MIDYVVRPKTGTSIEWQKYPYATLGISLGNSNEQGQKLQSIISWLNKRFNHVTIDFSDTLYRWNECTPDGRLYPNAEELAHARGNRWLAENQSTFDELAIPHELIRWDHWRNHPQFNMYLDSFRNLYADDSRFQNAVETDIEKFLKRRRKAGLEINSTLSNNCREFILEETAAHTILFRDRPYAIQVYPGDPLNTEDVLRRDEIPNAPRGMQGIPFVPLRVERAASALSHAPRPGQEFEAKPAA
jgi:tRNA-dependent cyclodipeptide synthase